MAILKQYAVGLPRSTTGGSRSRTHRRPGERPTTGIRTAKPSYKEKRAATFQLVGMQDLASRVYLGSSGENRDRALRAAFEYIGLERELSGTRKIFVKPNFTFPRPVRGVTTSREMLEDTLTLLRERGAEVFVGESNGGYGSFTAAEAFAGQGLHDVCRRTGAQAMDLSKEELEEYSGVIGGRDVSVRLARLLVGEGDFTISLPVLKVHAMTTVSLSIKNLWGCYPTDLRLLEHKDIVRKLTLISKAIHARYAIVDALYGLDEHGPMSGTARYLGKFVAGNDLLSLDLVCAKMMGFNPANILYLQNLTKFMKDAGWALAVRSNEDLASYRWGLTLRRDFIDTLSFAAFHSNLLAKAVFDSPATKPIYTILGREPRKKLT